MPIGRSFSSGRARLDAGWRDRAVVIEQRSDAATTGFPADRWTMLATVQMARQDAAGDERFVANQESAFTVTTWCLPYRADMDPDLLDVPKDRRLKYGPQGRVYNIRAARVLDRQTGIELDTLAASA